MKKILELQDELKKREDHITKLYGMKSINIDKDRVHIYGKYASTSVWYYNDTVTIRRQRDGEAPDTIEEFMEAKKLFEEESFRIKKVIEIWRKSLC